LFSLLDAGIGNDGGGWKVREIKLRFATPIGETLDAGGEKVGENLFDGLVLAFGGAGIVLQQLGNGKGEVSADDDHSKDEFAHRHTVGKTTFDLQDVLFSVGSGTIGGFKEGGIGWFTAHGDGLD
jgi:hypothetical protein